MSKKTDSLSKKIMLTLALGACFFAVQNPVMAEEVTVNSRADLPINNRADLEKDLIDISGLPSDAKIGILENEVDAGSNDKFARKPFVNEYTSVIYVKDGVGPIVIDTKDDLSQYMRSIRHEFESGGFYWDASTSIYINLSDKYLSVGDVSDGSATLKNGTVYSVSGAIADKGKVESNKLSITGGTVKGYAYGGYTEAGAAKSNELSITDGTVECDAYGGYTKAGVAESNKVSITGGTVECYVYGGYTKAGAAKSNKVSITGGIVNTLIGGWTRAGDAEFNTVIMDGGHVSGNLFGGSAGVDDNVGDANNNTVNIKSGTIRDVCGGYTRSGFAKNNTVNITGASMQDVTGGYGKSEASDNTVNVSGDASIGSVRGGSAVADKDVDVIVKNNTVNISAGIVNDVVYGGTARDGKTSNANNNTVNISGGTIEGVIGGMAFNGITRNANNNIVNISGGTIKSDVYCGYVGDGLIYDPEGQHVVEYISGGNANNNTVNISGGTIEGVVMGGCVFTPNDLESAVAGNTLNIRGLDIKAGNIFNFENINFFIPSSATNGSTMLTLTGIDLSAPDPIYPRPDVYYTNDTDISKMNVKAGVVAIEGDSKLMAGDTVILLKNEAGRLITTKEDGTEMTYGKLTAAEGVSVEYAVEIEKLGENALVGIIKKAQLEPQTKSLVETQAAGMAMLNGGMDMLAGEGIANAIAAAADASGAADAGAGASAGVGSSAGEGASAGVGSSAGEGASAGAGSSAGEGSDGAASDGFGSDGVSSKGAVGADAGREFAMFGMLGASNMKYKTGSHVDLNGWNLGLGFAKTVENNAGKLTFGPVISYGKGSYDSYLDNGIHGEGDSDYLGISLFAHQANKDGLYYEGSIGAGRVSNDYSSNDLKIAGAKGHEQYDTDSTFVAAHLGLGKKIEVSDKAKLDVYGKYFYAHQGGDDAKLATGETYHFDAVDSNRIRVGARYEIELGRGAVDENDINVIANANGANGNNGKANAGVGSAGKAAPAGAVNSLYVGTAYEYEFSGDAKATYKGMETPSPSLKGSSGMLELGWKVKPSAASPLTIDLSANGWCGQKEGYGLKANLLWNF